MAPSRAIIVAGLGFGDEGKGSLIDFLARRHRVSLVVRYNGGAQAGHHVVDGDRQHCSAQFGAGTLAGARTFLSEDVLVNPIFMFSEARHLQAIGVTDPLSLVTVDARALVTTPYHVCANRIREWRRGDDRHGSCGMGIGETARDALDHPAEVLRVGDLVKEMIVREKLRALRMRLVRDLERISQSEPDPDLDRAVLFDDDDDSASYAEIFLMWTRRVRIANSECVRDAEGVILFEGAQGVLLDQDYGFYPHTTWSDCTFRNAVRLLDEVNFTGDRLRLGVLRAYHTRHGAGPFPTERLGVSISGEHNFRGAWQGEFRAGYLDLPLLGYASTVSGGVDALAITCLDHLSDEVPVCVAYEEAVSFEKTKQSIEKQERVGKKLALVKPILKIYKKADVPKCMAETARAPVAILSRGPCAGNKCEM